MSCILSNRADKIKFTLLSLTWGLVLVMNAQTKLLANENSNVPTDVLFKGVLNSITIRNSKISRGNLEVYCKDFNLIDSIGNYYIKIPSNTEQQIVKIKLKDKNMENWSDSFTFKIKACREMSGQLSSLGSGGTFSAAMIGVVGQKLYSNGECLSVRKLKANIVSYRINVIDPANLEFISNTVVGPYIEKSVLRYFKQSKNKFTVKFDSVKTVIEKDTICVPPFEYHMSGDKLENFIVQFNDKDNILSVYNLAELYKVYNYGDRKSLSRILGQDTIVSAQRLDSQGMVINFKRYYLEKPGQVKLEVNKLPNDLYSIKYYNIEGKCIAEGKSLYSIFEINKMTWHKYAGIEFKGVLDSLHCFMYEQKIMPYGEWKFYHNDGKILAHGLFKPGNEYETSWSRDPTNFDFHHQYCIMTGIWKVYNLNGNVIQTKKF